MSIEKEIMQELVDSMKAKGGRISYKDDAKRSAGFWEAFGRLVGCRGSKNGKKGAEKS